MPEVAAPIYGGALSIGDGDVVGHGGMYVYKCKICDMPRMFKMNYISDIGHKFGK